MDNENNISYEQIRQHFQRDSEFISLLPPLLTALDWRGTLRNLVENLPHFAETINLVELRNTLARIGYRSEQIEIEATNIPEQLLPVLYVPDDDQEPSFIITGRTKSGHMIINDFTGVAKEISLENIVGNAYFFTEMKETPMSEIQRTTWFYEYLLQYKWIVAQALIMSLIINILLLATPMYVMNIYNRVVPTGSYSMLFSFVAAALFIMLSMNLLEIARTKILAYIGAKVERAISTTLINTVLYLPASMTEGTSLGKQLARLREFDAIRDFFSSPLVVMLFETPFIFVFIIAIWLLGGSLVIIPIGIIGVFAILYGISMIYVERANTTYSQLNSEKQSLQLEVLTNLRDIKSMGEEEQWLEKYRTCSAAATYASYRASNLSSAMSTISDSLTTVGGLVILTVGTSYAIEDNMSLGALVAIMMLIWKVLAPIKSFFSALPKYQQFATSIKQINSLATVKTEKMAHRETKRIITKENKITLSKVSFRYRSELAPALLGVSFVVEPNDFICLTGGSGSGKSTIFKLLIALYNAQAGNIYLNDMNITQIDVFELRNYIAYLPQRSDLFYGTILQNILFSCPTASHYEVEVATRLACIYNEIMALPDKFNSRISDQSSKIYSPSFQKRICLARAYLKRSSILLLDEPESNLDNKSAYELGEVINYFHGKRTIIMATHRPSYMRNADRILYFKEGQLVADDSPAEVFKKVSIKYL